MSLNETLHLADSVINLISSETFTLFCLQEPQSSCPVNRSNLLYFANMITKQLSGIRSLSQPICIICLIRAHFIISLSRFLSRGQTKCTHISKSVWLPHITHNHLRHRVSIHCEPFVHSFSLQQHTHSLPRPYF